MKLAMKVVSTRAVPWAVSSNKVAFGFTDAEGNFHGVFTMPDIVLRKSAKGYYFQAPAKMLTNPDGTPKMGEDGYQQKLEYLQLYTEQGAGDDPSKYAVTSDAWEGRKELIALLVEAATSLGATAEASPAPRAAKPAARPAARQAAKPTPRPAAAKTTIEEDEVGAPGDEDDDLPF